MQALALSFGLLLTNDDEDEVCCDALANFMSPQEPRVGFHASARLGTIADVHESCLLCLPGYIFGGKPNQSAVFLDCDRYRSWERYS